MLAESSQIRCAIDGTWPAHPACTAVTCDGSTVATPPNTGDEYQGKKEPGQPFDSQLVFTCTGGYDGFVTYTCGQNGLFATVDSCSSVTCDGSGVTPPDNTVPDVDGSTGEKAAEQS